MVTVTNKGVEETVVKMRGLSTDSKPKNVPNGSEFLEINTGKRFMFNQSGNAWVEQPSSGGGGGGATVANVALSYDEVERYWFISSYDKNAKTVFKAATADPNTIVLVNVFGEKYPFHLTQVSYSSVAFVSSAYGFADIPSVYVSASNSGSAGEWHVNPMSDSIHGEINNGVVENVDQDAGVVLYQAQMEMFDHVFIDVGSSTSEVYRLASVSETAAYFENVSGAKVIATEEGWSYQGA